MTYLETYNASEGFFALADDLTRDDMLLMLDYGTYYEFRSGEQIVPLEGVRVGEVYAMIVTSINGLWRYEIGDTVEFTSTNPYRIRFAGRTRQFINVFGEELIVDNAERALAAACERTNGCWSFRSGPIRRSILPKCWTGSFAASIRITTPSGRRRSIRPASMPCRRERRCAGCRRRARTSCPVCATTVRLWNSY